MFRFRRLIPLAAALPVTQTVLCDYRFQHGSAIIPHPKKCKRGSEDALFAKKHSLGIFDGVSSWMDDGIDAGIFAHNLCHFTSQQIKSKPLPAAVFAALMQTSVPGSATVCVVDISKDDGILNTFNLGESGFLLLRRTTRKSSNWRIFKYFQSQEEQNAEFHVFAKSTPMMHDDEDNCPFQLGSLDAPTQDCIGDAQTQQIQTQAGDILILATDGLFDNLSESEIVDFVAEFDMGSNIASQKQLAWLLAYKARQAYQKVDDISVIVAKIVDSPGVQRGPILPRQGLSH